MAAKTPRRAPARHAPSPVRAEADGWLGLVLVGAAALWWFTRDGVATDAGVAVGAAASNAAAGVVVGVGETIGVPATNQTACQQAIADGRTLDASFDCPALDFLRSLDGGTMSQVQALT